MKVRIKTSTDKQMEVNIGVAHRDGEGNLISYSRNRRGVFSDFLSKWDGWRMKYCSKHRHEQLPKGFREGRTTPYNLVWSYFARRKELKNVGGIC